MYLVSKQKCFYALALLSVFGLTLIHASSAVTACGGSFTQDKGIVLSPNYPGSYDNHAFCRWIIKVTDGRRIKLTFFEPFELEPSEGGCKMDTLKIFDVLPNRTLRPKLTWCGNSTPPDLLSETSELQIEFRANARHNFRGFSAAWTSVLHCGGYLSGNKGSIHSPDFPKPYPSDKECSWDINVSPGQFVLLNFDKNFDLGKNDDPLCRQGDYVEIFDGSDSADDLVLRGRWCAQNAPKDIQSFGSRMVVKFLSQNDGETVHGSGFTASWKSVTTCNKKFTTKSGYLMSYPNSVTFKTTGINRKTCKWAIEVPKEFRIRLVFNSTDNDIHCGDLKISDRNLSPYKNLCLENNSNVTTTTSHISQGNFLYLMFNLGGQGYSNQLYARWDSVCGQVLQGKRGVLTSPSYPNNYPGSLDCRWEIVSHSNSSVIRLNFTGHFDLEPSDDKCDKDYVEIFDSPQGKLASRGKYCGRNVPPVMTSYYGRLVVVFHSDGDKQGKGFSATWDTDHACFESFHSNHGSLRFPNIPWPYGNSQSCTWEIRVDPGYTVSIKFRGAFGLEENHDYLKIHEIDSQYATIREHNFTGSVRPSPIQTTTSVVRIMFTSDANVVGVGFMLTWDAACGGMVTGGSGSISSPNYGDAYLPNLDCQWEINTYEQHQIHLNFNSPFGIESKGDNCSYDSLEVFDGSKDLKGRYCGDKPPQKIVSSSSKMVIRFRSDADKSGVGFSLFWDSRCGEALTGKKGRITSPHFPSPYPDGFHCVWNIKAPPGSLIQLSFPGTFDIEPNKVCKYDYLEAITWDKTTSAQTTLGRWCGNELPPQLLSKSEHMRIIFKSDSSKGGSGFQADWVAVCEEIFEETIGNFSSPEYPKGYPANLDCRWEIKTKPGQRIILTFEETFELELNDHNCGYDHVEVQESFPNGQVISRGKWCGHEVPPRITSFSPHLTVLFHTDENKNGLGFKANWETGSGCRGVYETRTGYLMSPGYPNAYPDDLNCRWEIRPETSSNTTFSFDPVFGLESGKQGVDCSFDSVKVYVGGVETFTACGSKPPSDVIISGETLVVVFTTDKSVSGKGFLLSWKTNP